MAQYSRIEVALTMEKTGLVPLFFHSNIETAKQVLKACYDGGARLMEFTSRGDFAFEVFGELQKYAIAELPGMIMGVGSVTDAAAASLYMQLGCEIVKLFPGGIYGPDFIKAIKGPCQWTSIMPTGGVSPTKENLSSWFNAGVTCVGMGSKLMVKDANGNYDLKKITELTKSSLAIISELKK